MEHESDHLDKMMILHCRSGARKNKLQMCSCGCVDQEERMSVGQKVSVVNQDGDGQEWNDNSSKVCTSTKVEILELDLKKSIRSKIRNITLLLFSRCVHTARPCQCAMRTRTFSGHFMEASMTLEATV